MSSTCVFEWDGITQNHYSGECPRGEHCDVPPPPPPGTPIGTLTPTLCTPN